MIPVHATRLIEKLYTGGAARDDHATSTRKHCWHAGLAWHARYEPVGAAPIQLVVPIYVQLPSGEIRRVS